MVEPEQLPGLHHCPSICFDSLCTSIKSHICLPAAGTSDRSAGDCFPSDFCDGVSSDRELAEASLFCRRPLIFTTTTKR